MQINALIKALPPFDRKRDVIVFGTQSLEQIISEVLQAHYRYAYQYDYITSFFTGNALKKLFDFCQTYLPYREEPGSDQKTKSASAIVQSYSNDCKHYANFIAGTLDALNRTGKYNIDWCYRFVRYPDSQSTDHVFVVVNNDIWIDPTPIKVKGSGNYIQRQFNDRLLIPDQYVDIKADSMLSTLSGVHYTVDQEAPPNSSSCMGYGRMGSASSDALKLAAESDPDVAAVLDTANQIAGWLPPGGLKDWVNSFLADPTGKIQEIFVGRKYTTGDYKLGEVYMRNILGMMDIQRRGQVPDAYVPQAWSFFTLALGIPIGSLDHIDQLVIGAHNYKTWANNTFSWVPDDQVNRAVDIMNNYIGWTPSYYPRDIAWQLSKFASVNYIYPVWDIWAGGATPIKKYTGKHPITGIQLTDGFPYVASQPPAVVSPTPTPTPTTQTTPTTTTTPPPPLPTKGGLTLMEGLGIAAAAAVVIYVATKKSKHG